MVIQSHPRRERPCHCGKIMLSVTIWDQGPTGGTAMRFPKQRLRFTSSQEGRVSEKGYLVLDLKGLDIEGVTALVIPMEEVEAARNTGDREEDALRRTRDLLGG